MGEYITMTDEEFDAFILKSLEPLDRRKKKYRV